MVGGVNVKVGVSAMVGAKVLVAVLVRMGVNVMVGVKVVVEISVAASVGVAVGMKAINEEAEHRRMRPAGQRSILQ